MDIEKLIEQYRQAADKWEKRNPVTDTFDLRVQDALRDAATALSTLQAENEKLRAELENYRKGHCSEGGCAAEKDRDAVLAELEQVKRERDAAVEGLRVCSIENNMECQYCLYGTARSFCWNCTDGSNWKFRGQKEG